jgi:putative DNA primase/helicase
LETARERFNKLLAPFFSGALFREEQRKPPTKTTNILRLSDVTQQEVQWLWPEVLPLGFLSMWVSQEGVGKSTLARYAASIVTTDADWPNEPANQPPANVIWFSHEEDASFITAPSLAINGANLENVYQIESVQDGETELEFLMEQHAAQLRDAIRKVGNVKLIVLDPITSYTAVQENSNVEVRKALKPLVDIASEYNLCILGLSHLNKKVDLGFINRTIGSRAWSATPRMIWNIQPEIIENDDGKKEETACRFLMCVKSNLCRKPKGMKFEISDNGCVTFWDERLSGHADYMQGGSSHDTNNAEPWLAQVLCNGAVPVAAVKARATRDGVSDYKVRKACESMHVIKEKQAFSGIWIWRMPKDGRGDDMEDDDCPI